MRKLLVILLAVVFCSGKTPVSIIETQAVLVLTNNGSNLACRDEKGYLRVYKSKDKCFIDAFLFRVFKEVENKGEIKKGEYTFKINYEDLFLYDKRNKGDETSLCIYKAPFDEAKKSAKELLKDVQSPIKDLDDNQVVSLKVIGDKFVSFSVEGGGYSGGAHPSAYLNYFTYDIDKKKYVTFNELCKTNPDLPKKILDEIQLIAKTGDSEILYYSNQKQIIDQIENILLSAGYDYDPEHFYPDVKDGKAGIVFCFPHATEINRGTNYKVFVPLTKIPDIFKNYYDKNIIYPKLSKGKELVNTGGEWTVSLDKSMNLTVKNNDINKKLLIEKLSKEDELLDIFWIYDWPVSKGDVLKNFFLVSDYPKTYN